MGVPPVIIFLGRLAEAEPLVQRVVAIFEKAYGPEHPNVATALNNLAGLLKAACDRARPVLVGDIMTTELITITPDTHLLLIIDIMIKKHVRRLPVLEEGKMVGMVYLSQVFRHLLERSSE